MKRWIIAAAVAWGLVVAGFAYYSYRTDPPTDRDQTTIAQALPTVDTALADVAAALDPARTVMAVGGYSEVGNGCEVTSVRDGARYERVLVAYTREGDEGGLLDRVKDALPQRYGVDVTHKGDVHRLFADAGNYVGVTGAIVSPGQVRFSADTGCRPQDAPVVEPSTDSDTTKRAAVQAVLDTLRRAATGWRTFRLPCPSGGALWTVEASTGDAPASLVDALGASAPADAAAISRPQLVAFRTGQAGVAVRVVDGAVVVTSTTGCTP